MNAQTLDVRETMRILWRRRLLLIIPWAIATLAGIAGAFLLKPVYTSSVTLMLSRPQQLSGGLGDIGNNSNPDVQADAMKEQAKSTLFLSNVITTTGVRNDPATRAWALKEGQRLPGMTDEQVIDRFLINQLRDGTNIKKAKGNIFQITVEDFDRDRARKLAAGIADQFVTFSKHQQLEALRATQEFSVEQQQNVKSRLEESEGKLEAFRRNVLSTNTITTSVNEANVARARTLVEQAQIEADDLRQRASDLQTQVRGKVQERDIQAITTPQSNSMEGQIRMLEKQLASTDVSENALTSTGAAASVRLAIARKDGDLEAELAANAARVLPSLTDDVRQSLVSLRVTKAGKFEMALPFVADGQVVWLFGDDLEKSAPKALAGDEHWSPGTATPSLMSVHFDAGTFFDKLIEVMSNVMEQQGAPFDAKEVFTAIGFASVRSLDGAIAVDNEHVAVDADVALTAGKRGLLGAWPEGKGARKLLAYVPAGCESFSVSAFDVGALWRAIAKVWDTMSDAVPLLATSTRFLPSIAFALDDVAALAA